MTQTNCVDCHEPLVVSETTVASDGHTLICTSCEGKHIVAASARLYTKGGIRHDGSREHPR